MWLCETKPQESVVKIGNTLKRRLGIDDKVSKDVLYIKTNLFSKSSFIQKLILLSYPPSKVQFKFVLHKVSYSFQIIFRFFLVLSVTMTPSTRRDPQPRASTLFNIYNNNNIRIKNVKRNLQNLSQTYLWKKKSFIYLPQQILHKNLFFNFFEIDIAFLESWYYVNRKLTKITFSKVYCCVWNHFVLQNILFILSLDETESYK